MKEKNFQVIKQKQICHNGPWNVKTQNMLNPEYLIMNQEKKKLNKC